MEIYLIALSTLLLGIPILKFKSLYLKLFLFILWYPMVIMSAFIWGLPTPGVLALNSRLLTGGVALNGTVYYMRGYLILMLILYPLRKKIIQFPQLKIKTIQRFWLFILTMLSALPLLNTHSGGGVRSATFYIVCSTLLLVTHPKKDIFWFLQFCLSLALILLGERVDSLVIVILLCLVKGNIRREVTSNKKLYLGGLLFFILLVIIGLHREGGSIATDTLIVSLISQRTVCDVVYVYFTGVAYIMSHGLHSEVLFPLFFGLFSNFGVSSPMFYTNLLSRYMQNPGGGLFVTEGVVALGMIGVPLYFVIAAFLIKKIIKSKKGFSRLCFVLLCIMSFRMAWYGIIYIYKPLLILYILYRVLNLRKYFINYQATQHA